MQIRNKPVVLLVAEAVTLAHFARIVTLANTLDPSSYEAVVASNPRYIGLGKPFDCAFHPIRSGSLRRIRTRPCQTSNPIWLSETSDTASASRSAGGMYTLPHTIPQQTFKPCRKILYRSIAGAYILASGNPQKTTQRKGARVLTLAPALLL